LWLNKFRSVFCAGCQAIYLLCVFHAPNLLAKIKAAQPRHTVYLLLTPFFTQSCALFLTAYDILFFAPTTDQHEEQIHVFLSNTNLESLEKECI
jgi:hypothetical protein